MSWFKRIGLFLTLNAAVILSVSALLRFFNVQPYLTAQGLDYQSLLIFCLVWGMAGSFISLALSRQMAKWTMGVKVIDASSSDPSHQWLLSLVGRLAQSVNLPKMPEVGIYPSPEVNAFATGPTKSRALVAVSSGLLQQMNKEEIEGVLGHEIAHIANGDMVTMTLLQGVVNAFVLFLSRVAAFAVAQAMRSRDDRDGGGLSHGMYFLMQFVFEIVFMILGSMIVAWFSRHREYRADAGGAAVAGRQKMIRALKALERVSLIDRRPAHASVSALKISNRGRFGILFASHPPLEDRIKRLETSASL